MKKAIWGAAVVLSVAGVLLTLFLTRAHFQGDVTAICAAGSGCETVLNSAYAQLLGLPTALYGLLFYTTALFGFLVYPLANRDGRSLILNVLLIIHSVALIISVVLTYLSVSVLQTTCSYCLSSLGIIALLFVGIVFWYVRGGRTGEIEVGRTQYWQAGAAALAVLVLLLAGFSVYAYTTAPTASPQDESEKFFLAYDQNAIGNPGAPIRVVEFFDLECPHCQRFTLDTFPKIRENYIETGKVLWTFRHSPLPTIHEHAVYAHSVLSVIPPNRFLEAKKTIMQEAARWSTSSGDGYKTYFHDLLNEYGISKESITPPLQNYVRQRRSMYRQMGISGTPFFIVNGKAYGANRYEEWKRKFESLLKES